MQPLPFPNNETINDLYFEIIDGGEQLKGAFRYKANQIDTDFIKAMTAHIQILLTDIIDNPRKLDNPRKSIVKLSLLSELEHDLLQAWNDTAADFGPAEPIQVLFERQVSRTPDEVALVFGNEALTYADVNGRANQLAHYLMALGTESETLVAVAVERSLEMVIALLGVLKAGGAYVPIDPSYPEERIRYMLADCTAPILLTQSRLSHVLETGLSVLSHQTYVIAVDTIGERLASQSMENPQTQTLATELAYVIYTSGSTGQPKGVANQHDGVFNRLCWAQTQFQLTSDDCVLQKTPFSFDVSVWEFFWPLMSGASLLIAQPEGHQDPTYLCDLIQRERVTFLHFVPSMLRQFISDPNSQNCTSLRVILTSGEALPWDLAQDTAHLLPHTELHNLYGPTEAAIDVSHWPYVETSPTIPIGKPIANTTLYVLDSANQMAPIGISGELHIGGVQLARGYLGRSDLTAERFISHSEFGRLYKTGDLCRWLPDGNLEYLGRTDFQVKLRGVRIELGEIESVLLSQDEVCEVVVLAREDEPGDLRLVAYVVGEAESAQLLAQLSERLPAYMIPSAFVRLDALPLTPNGKVDRRALPAPDYAQTQTEFVPPRDDLEQQVAQIWREVLGGKQVGIYDTFFALGGHSLLATQVISRVRRQLQLDVPLKILFEAPQLGAFAQVIHDNLESQDQSRLTAIQPMPREGQLPLSFAQQRLWFLDKLEPDSAFYNIPAMCRLEGPLDVRALELSVRYLIERHESLRTTFDTIDGEPVQIIHDPTPLTLPVIAVDDLAQAQHLGQTEAITPFNLQTGPLLRVQLLKISHTDHLLLLTMHHIISDGWSIGVLIEELSHAYTAYVQDEAPTLADLPIHYADFAFWQRQTLSGDVLDRQLTFWREQLADAPALLELPSDRPRPPVQSYRGAHYAFHLEVALTSQLHQLAQRHQGTLFMVLLAAFKVLLCRYSGQRDIVVGSPIANRNRSELEDLIGFFVNTLVLRTQLDDNPSFTSLLQRVRQTTLEAYEHQDLPFEQLVDELQLKRTLSYSPLFQVMLVLQNVDQRALTLPHLTATSYDAVFPFARFDLTLNLIDQDSGLLGVFEYNTDLFDEASIARMAGHFAVLLNRMVLQPDQPVLTLPFLTETEHQQIVVEWNATATDYSADQTINQLFETQVERRPDSTAVVFEAERLTYRELNQRANQLAYFLQRLGVGPEVLVGICIERSIDMVVGLLGILKAGGAYVPLDPTYPADRLTFMLADADLSVLLTQAHLRHHLPQMQTGIVCLDSDWTDIQSYPHDNPTFTAEPAHLAYVIYTSGSTGQPKGVLVEHRGLYNLARAQIEAFGVDSHHRVLQFSSLNFDASISEIVMTLCSGATLYLAHAVNLLPGANLTKTLNQHRISHVTLVPSVITHLSPSDLPDLETVIVAGEACPSELVKSWSPGRRFFNAYGPTETTVCATIMPFEDDLGTYLTPPIGKPIANLQVYLVDEHLQRVPVGVPGELLIGGVGLARGYLNRPELTQEKFIPNPFGPGRLYKTGDLARWLPDGNLMFMGRTDFQVKIRGFRIELGEIENVLLTHDGIHEAVVLARENQLGDQSLIAYVVQDDDLDLGLLRQRLAQSLPAYMIPSVFVQLDAMPLTPNGKLDPQALPSPTKQADIAQRPLSETETRLRSIWKELLNLDSIGIHDNFFDIGGHSLLSVRLIARIQQDFGRDIDITTLFQGATIEILAELIDRQQQVTGRGSTKANTRSPLVALQPQGHGAPFFWVHPIGGRLFSYMKLAHCLGNQRPVYGLEALGLGLYSGEAPLKTIEAMASSYIKAIQTVQPRGPYYLGGWSFGGIVAFEMAQQLHRDGAEIGLLTLLESFIYAEATWHQQLAMQNDESPLRAEFVQDLQASMGLSPEEMLMQFIETTPSESLNAPTMPSDLEGYQRLWQVYKANRQAATQYHPKPYSGKPMFIWADQTNEHLKTAWYKVVTQADHHTVTGDHYSIMTDPTIRIIAQRIIDACSNSNDS
ncbi:non-ribosomal peptide synthetase [Candidatus Entotheonella serta]|nr:non-ribosomal peptide synthetase [Candidatus Entotheonella serta]